MQTVISEANRIKQRLRECHTEDAIERVADEERQAVRDMAKTPEGKPLALQIANLKQYRLQELEKGHGS